MQRSLFAALGAFTFILMASPASASAAPPDCPTSPTQQLIHAVAEWNLGVDAFYKVGEADFCIQVGQEQDWILIFKGEPYRIHYKIHGDPVTGDGDKTAWAIDLSRQDFMDEQASSPVQDHRFFVQQGQSHAELTTGQYETQEEDFRLTFSY